MDVLSGRAQLQRVVEPGGSDLLPYDPDDAPILIQGEPTSDPASTDPSSSGDMDPGDEPIGFPSGRGTEDDPIEGEDLEVTVEGTDGGSPDAELAGDFRWTDLLVLAVVVGVGWWLAKRSGVLDGVV